MNSIRRLAGTIFAAACIYGVGTSDLGAQTVPDAPDVTIVNDHMYVHKVVVFDARGEQHLLGFVGHDQVKTFEVPEKVEQMGAYRIALQQYLPLPGIGVPVDVPPFKTTPVLSLDRGQVVAIVVGESTELSSVEVY